MILPKTFTCVGLLLSCLSHAFANQINVSKLPSPAIKEIDFIRDIEPILSKSCYSCHGPDKQENDLRLDIKAIALKGGSSGPSIIPGKSAESRMIHLVAGLGKGLVMPKKGERLSPEQIGLLRAWIDQGANWPENVSTPKATDKADWWSFKPATRPALPQIKNGSWPKNPIDIYILARLEQEKLAPSPEADRVTLLRRLYFDLTGLPPTPEKVSRFVKDKSSDAYEKIVDQLLASPRYGERWARHWLDVVHFGETHGYDKDKPRLNAWPYRDYVIRSFNNDKKYSHFIEEQLAGDVLFPDEPDGIVALGFIAAGPWDFVGHVELPIEKTDGLIARYNDRDDMLMTTMSTFQSLTVHCARCHNHKFDAITQRDYYSLQAVFAGVDRADRSFDADKNVQSQRRLLAEKKKPLEERHSELTSQVAKISSPEIKELDTRLSQLKLHLGLLGLAGAEKSPGNGYHSSIEKTADYTKWVQVDLGKSAAFDEIRLTPARPIDFPDTPGFGFPLRFRVEVSDDSSFVSAKSIADHTGSDFKTNGDDFIIFPVKDMQARFIRVTATRLWERTGDYVFALAEMQVFANGTNVAFGATVNALDSIEAGLWSTKHLVDGFDSRRKLPNSASDFTRKETLETEIQEITRKRSHLAETLVNESVRNELTRVADELNEVNKAIAALPAPAKVYAATKDFPQEGNFVPSKTPRLVHLLSRGDVKRQGDLMTAAGVTAVPGPSAQFDLSGKNEEGYRRAALAKWITDPKNMLTRRSIVNRVWHSHFGRGIVETPNDFGHMGALPSHPELLDWMAFWFQENDESLKKLHRLIVTSATYRQSSASHSEFAKLDAENRFLWRMNRTRLDAETIRDSILSISGKLDLTMGGPSAQQFYFKDDHSPVYDYTQFDVDSAGGSRRSIYRFIVRSVPDPFMDSLDCPDASILTPKRTTTMTALQALAVLNNPFVLRQCEHLAARLAKESSSVPKQIERAYRLALGRLPDDKESKQLVAFAKKYGLVNACRVIFNSTEFMFVD